MARSTKLELEQLLAIRNTDLIEARYRISVLEGELALRPRTASEPAKAVQAATPLGAVVTRYMDRFGIVFERTRIGNRSTICKVA
jgi:hypothetical protein